VKQVNEYTKWFDFNGSDIDQNGNGNSAKVTQTGVPSWIGSTRISDIDQDGDRNDAEVDQMGTGLLSNAN